MMRNELIIKIPYRYFTHNLGAQANVSLNLAVRVGSFLQPVLPPTPIGIIIIISIFGRFKYMRIAHAFTVTEKLSNKTNSFLRAICLLGYFGNKQ
jgi:hypothetical protein